MVWMSLSSLGGHTVLTNTLTLLEGQDVLDGGLVAASIGKGHWAYCAYSLHTQIEAGLPGAWRLLANLAALGHAGPGSDAVAATPLELRMPKPPPRETPAVQPVVVNQVEKPPAVKPITPAVADVTPSKPAVDKPPVQAAATRSRSVSKTITASSSSPTRTAMPL